jgi:hypothetical protein
MTESAGARARGRLFDIVRQAEGVESGRPLDPLLPLVEEPSAADSAQQNSNHRERNENGEERRRGRRR